MYFCNLVSIAIIEIDIHRKLIAKMIKINYFEVHFKPLTTKNDIHGKIFLKTEKLYYYSNSSVLLVALIYCYVKSP